MATKKIELGTAGRTVAAQIRQLREWKRLGLQDLSDRLEAIGRPILPSGLSKVELGNRRVDVDDLVALAAALDTVPGRLLQGPLREPIGLTEEDEEIARAAMTAIRSCEAAGMSRYEVIEWMNMSDGVRRMMEQDPSGEKLAARMAGILHG
jgi:helix-turn-helix protein